jgi:hypothetical protein
MHRPPHPILRSRLRMLPVLLPALLVGLLAGHGVILYYVSSHVPLSAAVLSGAAILLVMKHVGLFGQLYAVIRRRRSQNGPG